MLHHDDTPPGHVFIFASAATRAYLMKNVVSAVAALVLLLVILVGSIAIAAQEPGIAEGGLGAAFLVALTLAIGAVGVGLNGGIVTRMEIRPPWLLWSRETAFGTRIMQCRFRRIGKVFVRERSRGKHRLVVRRDGLHLNFFQGYSPEDLERVAQLLNEAALAARNG